MLNIPYRIVFFWLVFALLLTYVGYRAYAMSFTIDEAMSYNYVLGLWEGDLRANNHWLNTFLMKVTKAVFGPWEWSLRLPNILSFVLYGLGVFGLLKRAKSDLVFYGATAILLFQPIYLEFFALARGYAMGVGLFAYGFYLLVTLHEPSRWTDSQKALRYLGVILMGSLVMFAYAAALNAVLMLIGLTLIHAIYHWKAADQRLKMGVILAMSIIALSSTLVVARWLLQLKSDGELFIGTHSISAWASDTFAFYFPMEMSSSDLIMRFLTLIVVLAILLWGLFATFRSKRMNSLTRLSLLVGLGSLFGWWIQHQFMEANYPQDRTGMIYYFLIAIGLTGLLLSEFEVHPKHVAPTLAVALGILSIWNASSQYTIEKTRVWGVSAYVKEAVLAADYFAQQWPDPVEVERHYFFLSSLNYYFRTYTQNIRVDEKSGIKLEKEILFVKVDDFKYSFDFPELIEQYQHIHTYDDVIGLYVRKDVFENAFDNLDDYRRWKLEHIE